MLAYSSTHTQPQRWKKVGGQRHSPAALLPGKGPSTDCTGGLVGFRFGHDGSAKYRPTGVRTPHHDIGKHLKEG
jgi:hypothetical protein